MVEGPQNMNAEKIQKTEEWKKAADFHGHVCPGLAIGFQAAKAGMEWLKENRSIDEELVAIVETNACGADAIQSLTGCTFGKGNFIYEDIGKQAFSFLSRKDGKGVRVSLKPGIINLSDEHRILMDKVRSDEATEEEKKRFWEIHEQRSRRILDSNYDEIFNISETSVDLPQKAKIEPSELCDNCGEPVMASKLIKEDGRLLCGPCNGVFEENA
jgi:formylmethanofuran dehydrogenase subunit E